jgi:hypothetical protein
MGFHRGPNIVRDGLVLALDAASPRSWTPGALQWFDLSGYNNTATAIGAPSTANAGTREQSIIFDGTNDYFTISPNETSLSFKGGQTVEVLTYHTFTSGRRNIWDQAYGGYGTWTHEEGANINYYYGTSGTNTTPYTSVNSSTTPTGQWNLLTVSRSSSIVQWYVNGVATNSNSTTYTPMTVTTNSNIRIGLGYAGYWIGNIRFVRAYNRGLSSSEVLQNYNAFKGRTN